MRSVMLVLVVEALELFTATSLVFAAAPPAPQDPLKQPAAVVQPAQPPVQGQALGAPVAKQPPLVAAPQDPNAAPRSIPDAVRPNANPVSPQNPLLPTAPGVRLQVQDPAPTLDPQVAVPGENPSVAVPPVPTTVNRPTGTTNVRGSRINLRGRFSRLRFR